MGLSEAQFPYSLSEVGDPPAAFLFLFPAAGELRSNMETLYLKTAVLVLASALGYSLATIGMKLASSNWSLVALCLIVAGFVASTQAEVILMRGVNLSVLYLAIIAVETLVVLVYAASIGEGLTQRQMLGGVFVLTGLAVISS